MGHMAVGKAVKSGLRIDPARKLMAALN